MWLEYRFSWHYDTAKTIAHKTPRYVELKPDEIITKDTVKEFIRYNGLEPSGSGYMAYRGMNYGVKFELVVCPDKEWLRKRINKIQVDLFHRRKSLERLKRLEKEHYEA